MADNSTRIVITASDQASAVLSRLGGSMQQLTAAAGGMAGLGAALTSALSGAAIAGFVKGAIDAADNLNDLSQRVGISIKDLGAWQLAAAQSGTSLEAVARGVKGLATNLTTSGAELRTLGITATDANQALIQAADLFAALPDGVDKTALAVKLFGKAGMDLIPMLNQGSAGLQEAANKAAAYAEKMRLLAPQADALNDQLAELSLAWKTIAVDIGTYAVPGLIGFTDWLKDATSGAEGLVRAMRFVGQEMSAPGWTVLAGLIERGNKVAALSGAGGNPAGRTSVGRIGGTGPTAEELAQFDRATDDYMRQRTLRATVRDYLGPEKKAAAAAAAGRSDRAPDDYADRINQAVAGAINNSAVVKSRELAAQIEALDKLFFSAGLDADVYASALSKITGSTDKAAQETDRLNELLAATPTAKLEETRDDMQRLAAAFESGRINAEQFNEAATARIGLTGEKLKETKTMAEELGMAFSSAFEDAIVSGESFRKTIDAIGQDILRILVRKNITTPLADAIGSFDFGSLFSANADGGVYAGAGISAFSGQVVSTPTVFPFARGIGLMGEAGPEAILPLKRGPGGKLGVEGGGSNVVVNVVESPGNGGQVQQRQEPGGKTIIDVLVERVKGAVAADIGLGGVVAGQMENTYGLNRAAGAWR